MLPVEFLSDDQSLVYCRFASGCTGTKVERYFVLDVDGALIKPKRRVHNGLGFGIRAWSIPKRTTSRTDHPCGPEPEERTLMDHRQNEKSLTADTEK